MSWSVVFSGGFESLGDGSDYCKEGVFASLIFVWSGRHTISLRNHKWLCTVRQDAILTVYSTVQWSMLLVTIYKCSEVDPFECICNQILAKQVLTCEMHSWVGAVTLALYSLLKTVALDSVIFHWALLERVMWLITMSQCCCRQQKVMKSI